MTLYRAMVANGAVCPEDGDREFTSQEAQNIRAQMQAVKSGI